MSEACTDNLALASPGQAERAAWQADPLLSGAQVQAVPRFMRHAWDENQASPFGPWRVAPRLDPALPPPQALGTNANANADAVLVGQGAPAGGASAVVGAPFDAVEANAVTKGPDLSAAALEAMLADAFERGQAQGEQTAQAAVAQERQRERELLRHLTIEMRALQDDPQRFFEPLKRLALHLAEQLVRAELQVSGKVVSQLVQQSLAQLDQPGDKVLVSLNPGDLQRLQAMGEGASVGMRLQADAALRMGSVRVQVNETVVQDLIENRIEALARRLLQNPEAWSASSSLLQDVVEQSPAAGANDRPWAKSRSAKAQGAQGKQVVQDVLDVQAVPSKNQSDVGVEGGMADDWSAQATGDEQFPAPSGE